MTRLAFRSCLGAPVVPQMGALNKLCGRFGRYMLYSPLGPIDPNKIEFYRVNDIVANARNAGDETILSP